MPSGEGRWGALAEPLFRRLFVGRLVSFLGSSVAIVALAFAVLEISGSPADLGWVLAAREIPQVLFLLVGGVVADRLPRNRVMVASNVVSGVTQAVTAALLLTGSARVWHIAVLAAVNGVAISFFFPASEGLVPQTVSRPRLQQANALLRLAQTSTHIGGAALGGLLVAATSPGWAIAADAVTYLVAATVLVSLHLPPIRKDAAGNFVRELKEGWQEFRSRTWLWAIVLQFSLVNAAWAGGFQLLGPVVADRRLGGAAAWGLVLSALSAGLVVGGLIALRWRTRRPLLVGTLGVFTIALPMAALAGNAAVGLVAAAAFAAGVGLEQFGVAWSTVMQEQIPLDRLSRVYSYDALGSIVFIPIGFAAAGPAAAAIGITPTIWIATAVVVAVTLLVLLSTQVRGMTRQPAGPPLSLLQPELGSAGS